MIASYRDAFLAEQGVAVASARAGNVIGGGDWSEDRLIPDAVRAWQDGANAGGSPPGCDTPLATRVGTAGRISDPCREALAATRPGGRLQLRPGDSRDGNRARCGGNGPQELMASGDVRYGNGSDGPHEAEWLALEIAKSAHNLGVRSLVGRLPKSIENTMSWYRAQLEGNEARTSVRPRLPSTRNRYESFDRHRPAFDRTEAG